MISVVILKSKDQYKGFSLEGHAGFARRGKDIVCSAVTVLVFNTLNSIEKFTDDGISAEAAPDGGYLKAEFTDENSKELKLLMDSMVLGLEGIEQEYGRKYISLQYKEV